MYSAMAPADFEKALARAHARLESGTQLSPALLASAGQRHSAGPQTSEGRTFG